MIHFICLYKYLLPHLVHGPDSSFCILQHRTGHLIHLFNTVVMSTGRKWYHGPNIFEGKLQDEMTPRHTRHGLLNMSNPFLTLGDVYLRSRSFRIGPKCYLASVQAQLSSTPVAVLAKRSNSQISRQNSYGTGR